MGKNFFTSDLHFGHERVIAMDCRPFQNAADMEKELIRRWNAKVGEEDTVYILGDFLWNNRDAQRVIGRLKGQIVLIKGNHDKVDEELSALISDIRDYAEIEEELSNGESCRVVLSHYFIPMYNGHRKGDIHLHGHSHTTEEALYEEEVLDLMYDRGFTPRVYNVGCMYWDYEPVTLQEILAAAEGEG